MGDTTRPTSPTKSRTWIAGISSGVLGGVGMGAMLAVGTNLLPLVGALYGLPGVVGGWLAHLFNSAVFGLLFAVLVSRPLVRQGTGRADYVVLGVAYGAGLGLVTGGVLLPLWLDVGGVSSLAVPFLPIPGFVGEFTAALVLAVSHLVYGVLLGAAYAETSGVLPEPADG